MRILHLVPDFLPRHTAGMEIYVDALASEQARRHPVTILTAGGQQSEPLRLRRYGGLDVFEIRAASASLRATWDDPDRRRLVGSVLDVVRPEVLHWHGFAGFDLSLPARLPIPSVATLHDHGLVCASGGTRVHQAERHVCLEIEPGRCARCFAGSRVRLQAGWERVSSRAPAAAASLASGLRRTPRLVSGVVQTFEALGRVRPSTEGDIDGRNGAAREAMKALSHVVSPSRFLGEEMVRLGLPRERLEVRGYGMKPWPGFDRNSAERVRIGFVGTVSWMKGVHVLLLAAADLPQDAVEVSVYGAMDTFPEYAAELRGLAEGRPVRFHGAFAPGDRARIYAGIDILVVPSLWLENSPLVIREAHQAGITVVGSDRGGIPELIPSAEHLFPAGDWRALAEILSRLVASGAWADPPRRDVTSIETDARCWEETYRSVARASEACASL